MQIIISNKLEHTVVVLTSIGNLIRMFSAATKRTLNGACIFTNPTFFEFDL